MRCPGLLSLSLLIGCLSHAKVSAQDTPTKPNLVILLSDDHGYWDSTVYGAKDVKTPQMQKLADRGLTFTHMFVASPSCAPSRAALLTGLMPARNGAERNHSYKKSDVASLTEVLKAQGYELAAFGKVAHGKKDVERHGFDHVDLVANPISIEKYLKNRTNDKPLALFTGTNEPHVPWPDWKDYESQDVVLPPKHLDTPETREFRCRYYTDVTKADDFVGDVYALTQEYLNAKNTLTIYTSDHGAQWPFGKWNLYDEGVRVPFIAVWPGVIPPKSRTNAMASWIDILPTLIDVAGGKVPEGIDGKSFLKVLRGEEKSHRNEIFATHTGDGNMNVYPIRCVRTEQWKLIWNLHPEYLHSTHIDKAIDKDGLKYFSTWETLAKMDNTAASLFKSYSQRPKFELYDLEKDPYEQNNFANLPKYQQQQDMLLAKLVAWMKAQNDQQTVMGTPRLIADLKKGQ